MWRHRIFIHKYCMLSRTYLFIELIEVSPYQWNFIFCLTQDEAPHDEANFCIVAECSAECNVTEFSNCPGSWQVTFLFIHKKLWKSAELWKDFLTVRSANLNACMLSKSLWYKDKWFGGNSYIKENSIAVHYLPTGRSLPYESGMLKGRIYRHTEIQYIRTVDNTDTG